MVCLLSPKALGAIGRFYDDLTQVGDERVIQILYLFDNCTRSSDW
jgi:predicted phosphoribosyltransferase